MAPPPFNSVSAVEAPNTRDIVMTWEDDSLASIDVCKTIDTLLRDLALPDSDDFQFRMILTELLNNSIDHGLLGLSSQLKKSARGFDDFYLKREIKLKQLQKGSLKLNVRKTTLKDNKSEIALSIRDSGEGFAHEKLIDKKMALQAHAGRGIKLVRCMCQAMHYSDRGRKVEVSYLTTS